MAWGVIIAWYLFLAGLSAGAYLTASFTARKYPDKKVLRLAGRYAAPVLIGVGLILLIFDAEAGLHHPLRFIYLLTNPTSVMTIGTYLISVFMMASLAVAALEFFKRKVPAFLEWTGIIFAVGTAVYTGFLIGVVGNVPLWNTAILPVLFAVSATSTGMAVTMLIAAFFDRQAVHSVLAVKKIHLGLLVTEVVLLFTMFYITSSTSEVARESVSAILSGEYSLLFWIGLMVIGLLFPITIEILELANHNKMTHSPAGLQAAAAGKGGIIGTVAAESGVLIGGFILRFLVLAAALPATFL